MKVSAITANLEISIRVEPSTTSQVAKSEENKLEIRGKTLKKLLIELSDKYNYELIDSQSKKLNPFYTVLVNGKYYEFLPRGISTTLKEGDEVDIFPIMFGGG